MADNLQKIQRFVVLMMENRSFDHLLGYLKTINPAIYGLTGNEYKNFPDPLTRQPPASPWCPPPAMRCLLIRRTNFLMCRNNCTVPVPVIPPRHPLRIHVYPLPR